MTKVGTNPHQGHNACGADGGRRDGATLHVCVVVVAVAHCATVADGTV